MRARTARFPTSVRTFVATNWRVLSLLRATTVASLIYSLRRTEIRDPIHFELSLQNPSDFSLVFRGKKGFREMFLP